MAMWQALSAVDAVRRRWARELGVEAAELAVVMLLHGGEPLGPADVAWRSGRTRQQEFRTLRSLRARGLVTPARCAADGSVQTWELTREGLTLASRAEARAAAWSRLLSAQLDWATFVQLSRRVTNALVNCRSTSGWRAGLAEPRECWSELDFGGPSGEDGSRAIDAVPDPAEPLDLAANSTKLAAGDEGGAGSVIVADAFSRFARWCDSDDPMAAFWRRLNR